MASGRVYPPHWGVRVAKQTKPTCRPLTQTRPDPSQADCRDTAQNCANHVIPGGGSCLLDDAARGRCVKTCGSCGDPFFGGGVMVCREKTLPDIEGDQLVTVDNLSREACTARCLATRGCNALTWNRCAVCNLKTGFPVEGATFGAREIEKQKRWDFCYLRTNEVGGTGSCYREAMQGWADFRPVDACTAINATALRFCNNRGTPTTPKDTTQAFCACTCEPGSSGNHCERLAGQGGQGSPANASEAGGAHTSSAEGVVAGGNGTDAPADAGASFTTVTADIQPGSGPPGGKATHQPAAPSSSNSAAVAVVATLAVLATLAAVAAVAVHQRRQDKCGGCAGATAASATERAQATELRSLLVQKVQAEFLLGYNQLLVVGVNSFDDYRDRIDAIEVARGELNSSRKHLFYQRVVIDPC